MACVLCKSIGVKIKDKYPNYKFEKKLCPKCNKYAWVYVGKV